MLRTWPLLIAIAACSPAPEAQWSGTAVVPSAEVSPAPGATAANPSETHAPTAIDGTLPDTPSELENHIYCGPKRCHAGLLYPPGGEVDTEVPVLMWSEEIIPQAQLSFPHHPGLTLYGVVMVGGLEIRNNGWKADASNQQSPRAWHAFRAPGVGVHMVAVGDQPTDVVLALVADGEPVATAMARSSGASGLARPRPMQMVDIASRPDLAFAKGSSHARIVFEDGPASLQILLSSADAPIPMHTHAKEWESVALLRGHGDSTIGPRTQRLTSGDLLSIPPTVRHGWKPAGDMELIAVQIYAPPGPEQRFKTLAKP